VLDGGAGMGEDGGGTKDGGVPPGGSVNISFFIIAGGCGGREVINEPLPL